jgi:HEAT repeat protein
MDVKDLNVEARNARVQILGNTHPKKYNAELFAAAKDSSKLVRNTALEFLPVPTEVLNSDILALLNGKKISEREVAVALLEKNFPECYKEAVQKAFESEKSIGLYLSLIAISFINCDLNE